MMKLPTPSSLNYMWNMGSILIFILFMQIVSGWFLSTHYVASVEDSFFSFIMMARIVDYGWGMRYIHSNLASLFFFIMYIHIFRGLYYSSYKLYYVWGVGVVIIFILMATAFLGYVLPWGQMSFWGATVITNLLSAVPYTGGVLVTWVWGGFSVGGDTLIRFYSLHFILPFLLVILVLLHILMLHYTGSSNPLGLPLQTDKIPFSPYYLWKDLLGLLIISFTLFLLVMKYPVILGDPENFIPANPMVTPVHIQPEWYLLFTYAILRSIPNKLGGVLALMFSILILLKLSKSSKGVGLNTFRKLKVMGFLCLVVFLTWMGMSPVEYPFVVSSQVVTLLYFLYFI